MALIAHSAHPADSVRRIRALNKLPNRLGDGQLAQALRTGQQGGQQALNSSSKEQRGGRRAQGAGAMASGSRAPSAVAQRRIQASAMGGSLCTPDPARRSCRVGLGSRRCRRRRRSGTLLLLCEAAGWVLGSAASPLAPCDTNEIPLFCHSEAGCRLLCRPLVLATAPPIL